MLPRIELLLRAEGRDRLGGADRRMHLFSEPWIDFLHLLGMVSLRSHVHSIFTIGTCLHAGLVVRHAPPVEE